MANTIKEWGNIIEIVGLSEDFGVRDLTDAMWGTDYAGVGQQDYMGICVKSITFIPSAASDVLSIKNSPDESASDPMMVYFKCADTTDQRVKYFDPPMWCYPFIDYSECTVGGSAASCSVIFELA